MSKQEFKNLLEVAGYLKGQGWKVSRSTVYKHGKEGRIRPDPEGTYSLKTVQRYARTHLMMKGTAIKGEDMALQRQKTAGEVKKLDIEIKLKNVQLMKEEGKYILREEMDRELAARAGVLQDGLRYRNRTMASDLIQIVSGDQERIADLIRALDESDRELLNQYASTREFEVVFNNAMKGGD